MAQHSQAIPLTYPVDRRPHWRRCLYAFDERIDHTVCRVSHRPSFSTSAGMFASTLRTTQCACQGIAKRRQRLFGSHGEDVHVNVDRVMAKSKTSQPERRCAPARPPPSARACRHGLVRADKRAGAFAACFGHESIPARLGSFHTLAAIRASPLGFVADSAPITAVLLRPHKLSPRGRVAPYRTHRFTGPAIVWKVQCVRVSRALGGCSVRCAWACMRCARARIGKLHYYTTRTLLRQQFFFVSIQS